MKAGDLVDPIENAFEDFEYLATVSRRVSETCRNSAQSIRGMLRKENQLLDLIQDELGTVGRPVVTLTEPMVYQQLTQGKTDNVWDLGSEGMQTLLMKVRPNCFEHLKATICMYRSQPLRMGIGDTYISRRNKREPADDDHPLLKNILARTYGVFLYHEQVEAALSAAGIDLDTAISMRKALCRTKRTGLSDHSWKEDVLAALVNRSWPTNDASNICDALAFYGGQTMSERHVKAFARLSYHLMWAKVYFPHLFYRIKRQHWK